MDDSRESQPWLPKEGSWLCADGPYRDFISKMGAIDPMLTKADKTGHAPLVAGNARVAMLEIGQNETVQRRDYRGAQDLRRHLESQPSTHSPWRRIYIMEGLAPDFVAVFGTHFLMTPTFFSRHERTVIGSLRHDNPSDMPTLPSLLDPEAAFLVKYQELRLFVKGLSTSMDYYVACATTGRRIAFLRIGDNVEPVGIVRRKCSYWARKDSHGNWDAVILCDPPVQKITALGNVLYMQDAPQPVAIIAPNVPFRGGYVDFIKLHDLSHLPEGTPIGPPRESMLEDLCFYYSQHKSVLRNDSPQMAANFVKKIAASQYMQLIEYLKAITGHVEWHLSFEYSLVHKARTDRLVNSHWLAQQWDNQMTLSRRCSEYCDDAEDVLLNLNISPFDQTSAHRADWMHCEDDFRYVNRRLHALKARVNQMNTSLAALAGLHENRAALVEAKRSSREAKSVKTLTLIGLTFIPLAYTCALFSMNEQYIPGSESFWLYFAVSVPLMLSVFVITFLMQLAFDDNGGLSLKAFIESVTPQRSRATLRS